MALGLLYSAEAHEVDPREVLASQPVVPGDYTCVLVEGVAEHLTEIDALIDCYAEGWTADRMPIVDRVLARIAVVELGQHSAVPPSAVLRSPTSVSAEGRLPPAMSSPRRSWATRTGRPVLRASSTAATVSIPTRHFAPKPPPM